MSPKGTEYARTAAAGENVHGRSINCEAPSMPILAREPDLHPEDLFERPDVGGATDRTWWALYCRSRQEKQLMRRLRALDVAFYSPVIEKRYRSRSGRRRTSYVPLFANYVFMYGRDADRHTSLTTGCVSRWLEVPDPLSLTFDLRQIQRLIETGAPLTAESRLAAGQRVRITSGCLLGLEGVILERGEKSRLFVAIDFLQQGASVELDDCQVKAID